jgi:hypothetical protein
VLGHRPRRLPALGVRVIALDGLWVAAGEVASAPSPTEAALRRHDTTVRRLARAVDALLPVRFGTVVSSEAELAATLAPRTAELRDALELVAGREQMTLRVYGSPAPRSRSRPDPAAGRSGPGARYLGARARARAVPEIDAIRPALAPFVRAERTERHRVPPLLASVYHLVDRGQDAAYRAALRQAARRAPGIRVRASGPWPPYAFAPEAGG